jgi:hypothetical protein
MHAKHSHLPTNVLVLAATKPFSKRAKTIARFHGTRCLVLSNVDPTAPERLFAESRSLWGKAWEMQIETVIIEVGADGALPPERFKAFPTTELFLDEREPMSALTFATALLRNPLVTEKMGRDAAPDHSHFSLEWDDVALEGLPVSVKKIDPPVFRHIRSLHIIAKCRVTVDEFPLRHGSIGAVKVAWASGTLLDVPALLVATAEDGEKPTISLKMTPGSPSTKKPIRP